MYFKYRKWTITPGTHYQHYMQEYKEGFAISCDYFKQGVFETLKEATKAIDTWLGGEKK